MAAPSKNFTTIADTSVDGTSPLTSTLLTALRDNGIHDRECVYDPALHTPAKAHEHTGVDSAKVKEANLDRSGGPRVFDDFLLDTLTSGLWSVVSAALQAGNNGMARITGTGRINSPDLTIFKLSGNTLTFEARVKNGTSAPAQWLGLKDSTAGTQGNEIIFGYYTSASNWWVQNSIGGTTTVTDTGVAVSTTAFQKVKFVATPSSIAFYIDDVLKATHTTNIPTAGMGVILYTTGQLDVDYVDCASSARV